MYQKKLLPVLYGKSRTGKIKSWSIYAMESESGQVHIVTLHGYVDGKKQRDAVEIKSGKNIGRANETTKYEQAVLEAQSKWNKKVDKGYAETVNTIPTNVLPMLAKCYGEYYNNKLTKDMAHKISYPCYVQPKLNGVRCLTKRLNGDIDYISRKGKKYSTLTHIDKELKLIMSKDDVFDGEIYVHGVCFQDVVSAVKNIDSQEKATFDCSKLKYWIYDIANADLDFQDRTTLLREIAEEHTNLKHIVICPTFLVNNENDMLKFFRKFIADGYEGIIIRNQLGKYEFDYRSDNLQKLKEFKDEEFKIIDVISGRGRYSDCATFVCKTKSGKQFNVNPEGTIDKKKEYLRNKNKLIGKLLTVKYQEKSKDGIPVFPVGIIIRNYE